MPCANACDIALDRARGEDVADMTAAVPGLSPAWRGPGPGVHDAGYDFDDTIIPIDGALLARLIERRIAVQR